MCHSRRHGHNEGDDPSYTQPLMYKAIANHPSVRKIYVETLVKRGDITEDEADQALADYQAKLQVALEETRASAPAPHKVARPPKPVGVLPHIPTGVDEHTLNTIFESLTAYPDWFTPHPKLAKQFDTRCCGAKARSSGARPRRWRSVRSCSRPQRLAGEDLARTFAHRHAASSTTRPARCGCRSTTSTGPTAAASGCTTRCCGVRRRLRVRLCAGVAPVAGDVEAQFGDFINCAQVVVDQYLVAAEDKWGSATVWCCCCRTAITARAQSTRRLVSSASSPPRRGQHPGRPAHHRGAALPPAAASGHTERHTPLIVFTPKEGLRMKQTRSSIDEFTSGSFQEILDDPGIGDPESVERIIFCTGKIAWEAIAERDKREANVAVVRRAALPAPAGAAAHADPPLPERHAAGVVAGRAENMGAWSFIEHRGGA